MGTVPSIKNSDLNQQECRINISNEIKKFNSLWVIFIGSKYKNLFSLKLV